MVMTAIPGTRPRRSGAAGRAWSHGSGGEEIEMDAAEFCRVLSGRGTGTGLLETQVPFQERAAS